MHSVDTILKPLILNMAIVGVLVLSALISIPCGLLISRRIFQEKPVKTRLLGTVLLTGALFSFTTIVTAAIGLRILTVTIINPGRKMECAKDLRLLARQGSEWAATHGGRFPADFTFLSDDQAVRMIIVDHDGTSDRDAAQKSYELVTPGATATDLSALFLHCPLHAHSVRVDGTIVADKPAH